MSTIKAFTVDQRLFIKNLPLISSGDVGTDFLEMKFDRTWNFDGVSYYALFYKTTPESGVSVELSENNNIYSCTIPSEMLTAAGRFSFAVYAKNGQGSIIKTSTVCNVDVKQGAYTGAPLLINWAEFKSELIEALNERFNAELAETATTEEIIAKINELENADTVKAWFIDKYNELANDYVNSSDRLTGLIDLLNADMSDSQIETAMSHTFRDFYSTAIHYLAVQDIIAEIDFKYHFYEGMLELNAPTANFTAAMTAIKNFIDDVSEEAEGYNSSYTGLRNDIIQIIPTDDEGFSFDSNTPDTDLVSAINSAVSVKSQTINSMYLLYTGGIVNA